MTAQMLFELQYNWFPAWHISFHLGVDGISVAMILLTAFVVIAGVLVSWNVDKDDQGILFLAHPVKSWVLMDFLFRLIFLFFSSFLKLP